MNYQSADLEPHPDLMSKPAATKKTPYSRDAERSVLGAIMMDNRSWDLIIDQGLSPDDFFLLLIA